MKNAIEIYEWEEGAPRPGTVRKARETCIDILAIPPNGQVPLVGDIVMVNELGRDIMDPTRFRVIDREFMWVRPKELDSQTPTEWVKLCIHVRRLVDETK